MSRNVRQTWLAPRLLPYCEEMKRVGTRGGNVEGRGDRESSRTAVEGLASAALAFGATHFNRNAHSNSPVNLSSLALSRSRVFSC